MKKTLDLHTDQMLDALLRGDTPACSTQSRALAVEWQQMQSVWQALDAWAAPAPSASLRARVLAQASEARPAATILTLPARRFWLAAASVLLVLGALFVAYSIHRPSTSAPQQYLAYQGADAGTPLKSGETIQTQDTPARITCPDGSVLSLREHTGIKLVATIAQGGQVFRLLDGTVHIRVHDSQAGGDRFRLLLPDGGVVEDLSTEFVVTASAEEIAINILDGHIRVQHQSVERVMAQGDTPLRLPRAIAVASTDTPEPAETPVVSPENTTQDAISATMRAHLDRLKAKAARTKGEDWVEAIREMVDITNNLSAQQEVLAYLVQRIRTKKSPIIEVEELDRALRHTPRPTLPDGLVQVLANRAVDGDLRMREACLSALRAVGPDVREKIQALPDDRPGRSYDDLLQDL